MYVYCLYCRTQRCGVISEVARRRGFDQAFSPKVVVRERKRGELRNVTRDLLPGYIFLYHHEDMLDSDILVGVDGVIRRIGLPAHRYDLQGEDRSFAEDLFQRDGVLGNMPLIKEGNEVRMMDSLFAGHAGRVLQVDHKKQRAKIEFVFDGKTRRLWVGCDVLYLDEAGQNQVKTSEALAGDGWTHGRESSLGAE